VYGTGLGLTTFSGSYHAPKLVRYLVGLLGYSGDCGKLHNEKLCHLCSYPSVDEIITSRGIEGGGDTL
jgi:hypothetical protein